METTKIKVYRAEYPEDPFSDGCFGQIWIWHTNYGYESSEMYDIPEKPTSDRKRLDVDAAIWEWLHDKWWEDCGKIERDEPVAYKPIYMYDHSGITISTTPYSCPWDSGLVGITWASREQVERKYGECTEATIQQAEELLKQQINILRAWYEGDCWIVGDNETLVYGGEEVEKYLKDINRTEIEWI